MIDTSSLGVTLAITFFCLYLLVTRTLKYRVRLPMRMQLMIAPVTQEMLTVLQVEQGFLIEHGCQPANQLTNKLPFGVDGLMKIFQAHADNRLMALFVRLYRRLGDTFEHNVLGSRGFATINPHNLEAILSKQFHG